MNLSRTLAHFFTVLAWMVTYFMAPIADTTCSQSMLTNEVIVMINIKIAIALSAVLAGSVYAQDSLHGESGTSYRSIGNTTYGSDGSSSRQIGNTSYDSNGSTTRRIGSTTYNSDGSSSRQIGNTLYNSDGTSVRRIGNSTYGSDGTVCRRVGSQTYCN